MPTIEQLSENSHQGFEGIKAALCLAEIKANPNPASGMAACLRPNGTGSRCSGKERDAESGLDYFGARYFSGAQGRFTSPDPLSILEEANSSEELGEYLSNPQLWNKYAYSLNNPLKYVDPDGKNPVLIQLAQLIQRAANTPAGQRAINFISNQGVRLYNAATAFFNSPTGQELTQSAIETIGGVPLGVSISPRSVLAREVNAALETGTEGARLEGQVARTFFNDVVSFNKQVFSAGRRIGEIDVELKNAIVEVTTDQGGKAGQAGKLVNDKVLNPLGKVVIVYGPNITKRAGQAIEAAGARVARTPEELKKLLEVR